MSLIGFQECNWDEWKVGIKLASDSESRSPHSLTSIKGSFFHLEKTDGPFDYNGVHFEELSQFV